MRATILVAFGVALAVTCTARTASATTLTFDDITSASTALVPSGYGGLNWVDLSVANGSTATVCAGCINGYANGRVSGDYVAYRQNGGPTPAEVTSTGMFDFISVYVTAANDKNFRVQGYNDGTLLYDRTVVVNVNAPTLFAANYLGVDRVVFSSTGGTGGYSPLGDTYALDNFTYNEVPEPTSLLLVGTGLAMGVRRFRRRLG
jgi:hypothetical protein